MTSSFLKTPTSVFYVLEADKLTQERGIFYCLVFLDMDFFGFWFLFILLSPFLLIAATMITSFSPLPPVIDLQLCLTGQCVKRLGRHELLRHLCTCIPDIPFVYHLAGLGASLDLVPTQMRRANRMLAAQG